MQRNAVRRVALGILFACGLAGPALAQQPAAPANQPQAGPPAGFVAPAEPQPGDTNGERAKSQPGNNAPFWRSVRNSGNQQGFTSLPGVEQGTLIQRFVQFPGSRLTTAGEAWREVRNRWIIPYGGALLLIALGAVVLHYWRIGPLGSHDGPETGRKIERFTPFERSAHWANAIAFVVLAISGIVMAFGKFFLLPILGTTLFGWLTYALKTLHNLTGPLFAVSLVIVFFTFLRDELPQAGDMAWIKKGGGLLGGQEAPSHRFNAGEKVVFWASVVVLGGLAVGSGLVLDRVVPGLDYTRGQMQVAHLIHSVVVALMMAVLITHIYLGTVGMKGAYQGMRTGYVDESWAQAHHSLWYADVKAGRIPAQRSGKAPPSVAGPAGAQT
jgi:formate dehydrogenase subunit gamma